MQFSNMKHVPDESRGGYLVLLALLSGPHIDAPSWNSNAHMSFKHEDIGIITTTPRRLPKWVCSSWEAAFTKAVLGKLVPVPRAW
jgi:hypothetical protein